MKTTDKTKWGEMDIFSRCKEYRGLEEDLQYGKRKTAELEEEIRANTQALYNYKGTIEEYQADAKVIEDLRQQRISLMEILNGYEVFVKSLRDYQDTYCDKNVFFNVKSNLFTS